MGLVIAFTPRYGHRTVEALPFKILHCPDQKRKGGTGLFLLTGVLSERQLGVVPWALHFLRIISTVERNGRIPASFSPRLSLVGVSKSTDLKDFETRASNRSRAVAYIYKATLLSAECKSLLAPTPGKRREQHRQYSQLAQGQYGT
jgi:hypothetical protein